MCASFLPYLYNLHQHSEGPLMRPDKGYMLLTMQRAGILAFTGELQQLRTKSTLLLTANVLLLVMAGLLYLTLGSNLQITFCPNKARNGCVLHYPRLSVRLKGNEGNYLNMSDGENIYISIWRWSTRQEELVQDWE